MKAQSKVYIQLQGIYKAKARKDAAEILQIVQAAPGGERVDPAEVDLFCKNAAFVKLINATGGTGSEISRADRLKSAAGKHKQSSLPVTPPQRGLDPPAARASEATTPEICVPQQRRNEAGRAEGRSERDKKRAGSDRKRLDDENEKNRKG
jgi:hypothetical protein